MPVVGNSFRRELAANVDWFNGHRPHTALDGRTPDDVYFGSVSEEQRDLSSKVIQITSFKGRPNLPVVRLVDAA